MVFIAMMAVNSAFFYGKKKSKRDTPSPTPYPTEELDCEYTGYYLDRDNEYGFGDYERVKDFAKDGKYVCGGEAPVDAICREVDTHVLFEDYDFSNVRYAYCDQRGFLCYDGLFKRTCPDFEVQFCCPL